MLKPKKDIDCDCEEDQPDGKTGKKSFIQTKTFLGIVTVFAALMLAFPYYSHIFYPEVETNTTEVNQVDLDTAEFQISGMTCTGCEEHVTHAVSELEGIQSVQSSYEKGRALVRYDKTKTDKEQITEAINATGYEVTD
jgi:copper ion binding protein